MDANKLKVLMDIEYEVKQTCDNCARSNFPSPTPWGTCTKNYYVHLKHGDKREMSINRNGWCYKYEAMEPAQRGLDKFEGFFNGH